ncbi:hypothetical protein [Defluviimonas sp. WL0075]|uniref:Uncharacterized protein n=1 Tax=Albidovulum sediminicola TaxID=2984331 RepID=A0ABT2Z1T0_9RHOB|nr:hypothetical protein [Defluviimonas sp. WL0075]MCV2865076.1 hypothetical protein [Defluviimonas sp. WL0075]
MALYRAGPFVWQGCAVGIKALAGRLEPGKDVAQFAGNRSLAQQAVGIHQRVTVFSDTAFGAPHVHSHAVLPEVCKEA